MMCFCSEIYPIRYMTSTCGHFATHWGGILRVSLEKEWYLDSSNERE